MFKNMTKLTIYNNKIKADKGDSEKELGAGKPLPNFYYHDEEGRIYRIDKDGNILYEVPHHLDDEEEWGEGDVKTDELEEEWDL